MKDRPNREPADALRPARVLMVDDYPANLLVLEGILEPLGLELVGATSGEEALMHVLRADFALILMDVQMPGMDGFTAASMIKNRERSRHVPIIFLTAISRDAEHIFEGYAHGAVDYLLKPFHPSILRSKVQVFVDIYRQAQIIQRQQAELRQREIEALEVQNERRFRELTDALPNLLWGVGLDGRVYYTNRAWQDQVGGSDAPIDVFHLPAIHPDDADEVRDRWKAAIAGGEPFEWQFRVHRAGAWRWHLGRAVPERDERGAVVGWVATSTDIDDRKRAERVLSFAARASSRLGESLSLATTAEAVADLLVPELGEVAAVHLVAEPNGPALQLEVYRGADADKLRAATTRPLGESGRPLHAADRESVIPPVDDLGLGASVSAPLTAKGRVIGQLWVARAEPPFAPDEIQAIEDLARRGSAALDNAALFDVAQHERARAESANRVKDEFLAAVSHELRSPISAIVGWAELLASGRLPADKQEKALETILRSAKSQTRLIEDLLDSARITTGKLRLECHPISIQEVVDAAIDIVRPSATAKQIDLNVGSDTESRPVVADPNRLQQVVWNLVANAIKFTPEGGRVSVGIERSPFGVDISVRDEGEGVSADFLPFVFDAFRQADSGRSGLGLGLAISKELVTLHGGTISVASEGQGKGTTFVVSLPTGPPD